MSASEQGRRIGQSGYWARFAILMVGVPTLIGFGLYSLLVTHAFGLGLLSILAILPLSIWFRFVMMRRCRDVGWPIFLPWSAQGLQFLMFFLFFTSGGLTGGVAAAQTMSSGSMLIGLADFVLVIALGCVKSRDVEVDYADVFGDAPVTLRARPSAPHSPADYGIDPKDDPSAITAREDAAIARALAAYRSGGAEPVRTEQPARMPQPAPMMATPRAGGFGRKGL